MEGPNTIMKIRHGKANDLKDVFILRKLLNRKVFFFLANQCQNAGMSYFK